MIAPPPPIGEGVLSMRETNLRTDLEIIQFQLMPEEAFADLNDIICADRHDVWGLAMRAYGLGFIHGVRQERTRRRKEKP
jgi:hypothetical protein